MPRVYKKGGVEHQYIIQATRAGVSWTQIQTTLVLAKLLDKDPMEVQAVYTEVSVGFNQAVSNFQDVYPTPETLVDDKNPA